ncbi:MAG: signal transduction histidine kinase [Flavobacteriales bacterium]|jgi:signal transduction histidine kinase
MKNLGSFLVFFALGIVSYGQLSSATEAHQLVDSLRFNFGEMRLDEVDEKCGILQDLSFADNDTVSLCWASFILSSKLAKIGNSDLAFSELEKVKSLSFESSDLILECGYWQSLAVLMFMHMEEMIEKDESYGEADVLNDSIRSYIRKTLIPEVLERDPLMYTRSLIFQSLAQRWVSMEKEALAGINKADVIVKENNLQLFFIAVLNIRAMLLTDLNRRDEALMLYEYAIKQAKEQNNTRGMEAITYNYGNVLFNLDNDQKALEMFLISYQLSLNEETSKGNLFAGAEKIKECYYYLEDYQKALEWAEIAHGHHREMETADLRLRFEKMQIETANFENERLAFKHAEKRLKAEGETTTQKRNALIAISIALLIIVLLGAYYFFNKIRSKNNILRHEKEVSELIRRQEISSMEAMISGQEAERKRVGRELHDNIGSMLSTLGMHFSTAFEKSTGKEVSEVPEASRVIELLDNTISETRKLSHDMMAGVLNRFGLVSAVRDLCDQISETGKVNVLLNSIGMDERLEAMMELNLYRIAQELVSNALKHADPETIRINLVRKTKTVVLQVRDDGMGMTHDQFENGNGAGFSNVNGRVAALQGKLEFEKKQEQGTLIRIIVPLKTENNGL